MRTLGRWLGLIAAALLWSSLASAEVSFRLTTVENPDAPNESMVVIGFNNKGEVVGYVESIGIRAFRWKDGVYTDLALAAGSSSNEMEATGINDRSIIVGHAGSGAPRAFRFRNDQLIPVHVTGESVSLYGINNRNQIVGRADGVHFLWQQGVQTALPGLPGSELFTNQIYSLNDQGVVAGVSGTPEGTSAVLWKNGGIEVLAAPIDATHAEARSINNLGQVVGVAYSDPLALQSFIWTDGVASKLTPASSDATSVVAMSINNWGAIVGDTVTPAGRIPTLWRAGKPVDIHTLIDDADPLKAAVTLRGALRINDRGQILAVGHNAAANRNQPYLLTPSYRPH